MIADSRRWQEEKQRICAAIALCTLFAHVWFSVSSSQTEVVLSPARHYELAWLVLRQVHWRAGIIDESQQLELASIPQ